jgi:hypothetical protein
MRDFFGTRNTFSKSTGVGSRFSVHYVEMDHHDHNYYAVRRNQRERMEIPEAKRAADKRR